MEAIYKTIDEVRHTIERVRDLSLLSTGITGKLIDLLNKLVEQLEKKEEI